MGVWSISDPGLSFRILNERAAYVFWVIYVTQHQSVFQPQAAVPLGLLHLCCLQ